MVQDVGAVGGGDDDDALVGAEAVHLHQHLVQGLLAFIVTAAQTGAALAAHRVDLIDEDDTGRGLFRLVEQITHTGSTHAHIHLHEIGTGDRVEGHARLTGAGTGQQGFTGTRRAHQQHAVGNAGTQTVELTGILEELHNFFQLGLFLVRARHIGKGGLALVVVLVLHLGAAHIHDVAALVALEHHIENEDHAAHHDHHHHDVPHGHAALHRGVILIHGCIGMGLIVGLNIRLHLFIKDAEIGHAVFHLPDALAAGQLIHSFLGIGGALALAADQIKHTALGQLASACRLLAGIHRVRRQLHVALHQCQLDVAGVQVHLETDHLLGLEVAEHPGVAHGSGGGVHQAPQIQSQHAQRQQHDDDHAVEFWFTLQRLHLLFRTGARPRFGRCFAPPCACYLVYTSGFRMPT